MKYRSWIGQAVAAITDGKGSRKKDSHNQQDALSMERREDVSPEIPELRIAEEITVEQWKLRLENPKIQAPEKVKGNSNEVKQIPEVKDELEWRISGSASSDTLPMRSDSQASTSNDSTTTLSTIMEPAHETNLSEDLESANGTISSAVSDLTSTALPQNDRQPRSQEQNRPPIRQRTKSTSSTIFKQSSTKPITIILTTPDSDPVLPDFPHSQEFYSHHFSAPSRPSLSSSKSTSYPTTRSFSVPSIPSLSSPLSQHDSYLPRNTSTTSLPSTSKSWTLDPSRLMPPSEQALDATRLLQAQEYRSIRKYMITFLNTKGHTFPVKLRLRIMQAYRIEEGELDPHIAAQLKHEGPDSVEASEGSSSKEPTKEPTNAANLAILSRAFQSQIPVVTPHLETAYMNTIPSRLPHKSTIQTFKQEKEMRGLSRVLPGKSKEDTFGKLLRDATAVPEVPRKSSRPTTSKSTSNSSVRTLPHVRPKAASLVSSSRSSEPRSQRQQSLTPIPMDKQLKLADQQTRIKRQSILSGAFGAVRDAVNSSSKSSSRSSSRAGRGP